MQMPIERQHEMAHAEAVRELRIVGHGLLSQTQDEDPDLLGLVTDAISTLERAKSRLVWIEGGDS